MLKSPSNLPESTLYRSELGLYPSIITSFKSRLGKDLTEINFRAAWVLRE